ncbi:glycosyltransferase family 1 protein, partial [Sinorhizobium meliloti]
LFARLKGGPSTYDLERAEAGARYVLAEHTWSQPNDI